jgi:membrane protease YdiL (CAAX protease family)
MADFPSIADHALVWIFGIILPFLSGLQSHNLSGAIQFNEQSRKRLYLSNSLMLAIAGSAILLMWTAKQRSFDGLGFRFPNMDNFFPVMILVFAFLIGYAVDLYLSARKINQLKKEASWFERSSFLPESFKELPSYIILCLSAGIFEEIIYRGFMVTYFLPLISTPGEVPWMAILAPSILFSLAHTYQGWIAVIKIFIFSILLGIIFILSKSIYPTMVLHFFIDLIGGIVALIQYRKQNH